MIQPAETRHSPRAAAVADAVLICAICSKSQAIIERCNLVGLTPGEQWDAIEQVKPAGWSIRIHPQTAARCMVCPACREKEQADAERSLIPYSGAAPCPKCRAVDVTRKWCDGTQSACNLLAKREHLHRRCEQCGYSWIESTADTPKNKGWFQWLKFWKR